MKWKASRYALVDDAGKVLLELPVEQAMQVALASAEAFPVVDSLPAVPPTVSLPLRGMAMPKEPSAPDAVTP